MNDYNSDDKLYPTLQDQKICDNASSFRLKKISEILKQFEDEKNHYSGVRKKYKRFQSVFHNICVSSGSLSVILSMSALTTSLSGFGIVVGIPIGGIAGLCGIISIVGGTYSKKLGKKVSKHEQIMTVAKSKINSIKQTVSIAIQDGKISNSEFESILSEVEKFEELKKSIRNRPSVEKKEGKSLTVSNSYMNLLRKEIQESMIKNLRLQPSAPPQD